MFEEFHKNKNTYLLSSLIYIHGISIKSFDHYYDRMTFDYHFISSILHNIRFMVNSENYYEEKAQNKIEYLKAIFTPPASWIKEAQKNVMPTMGTFMLCLYRLKQQQPASFSIPKRLMNSCIVPLIIKNTIDQKTLARCNTVNANLQESVDFMRKGGYREGDNIVTDFLYNELGQWLEQNTNICQILYNTLMNPR